LGRLWRRNGAQHQSAQAFGLARKLGGRAQQAPASTCELRSALLHAQCGRERFGFTRDDLDGKALCWNCEVEH
jgi:hypothetical protein